MIDFSVSSSYKEADDIFPVTNPTLYIDLELTQVSVATKVVTDVATKAVAEATKAVAESICNIIADFRNREAC
jgi:hypothetical protein